MFTMYDKTKFIGTATARIGYLFVPQALSYVKGGAGWTNNNDYLLHQPNGRLSESASFNTNTGWAVGGGLEWMFAPGWSVFGEYNYMDFGTNLITFIAAPGNFPPGEHVNISLKTQTALIGVNYQSAVRSSPSTDWFSTPKDSRSPASSGAFSLSEVAKHADVCWPIVSFRCCAATASL